MRAPGANSSEHFNMTECCMLIDLAVVDPIHTSALMAAGLDVRRTAASSSKSDWDLGTVVGAGHCELTEACWVTSITEEGVGGERIAASTQAHIECIMGSPC